MTDAFRNVQCNVMKSPHVPFYLSVTHITHCLENPLVLVVQVFGYRKYSRDLEVYDFMRVYSALCYTLY